MTNLKLNMKPLALWIMQRRVMPKRRIILDSDTRFGSSIVGGEHSAARIG